jgi:hydroxyacylglutathione hydrolase
MLHVEQFRCGADNFSYLIYGERQAVAVDGVAWQEILAFLKQNKLDLALVTNTHGHFDHTSGNDHLLGRTKAKFFGFAELTDNKKIQIDSENIFVWRTPGHTEDSVCFRAGNFLISGDTLFNGTIGNCFTGDLQSFYLSVKRLMTLPDETIVCAGHDYVHDSLAFAARLEPDNKDIDSFRASYDFSHVYSTMAEERRINPYLRFNEEPIISLLKKRGLPVATEGERWQSLMSIE